MDLLDSCCWTIFRDTRLSTESREKSQEFQEMNSVKQLHLLSHLKLDILHIQCMSKSRWFFLNIFYLKNGNF